MKRIDQELNYFNRSWLSTEDVINSSDEIFELMMEEAIPAPKAPNTTERSNWWKEGNKSSEKWQPAPERHEKNEWKQTNQKWHRETQNNLVKNFEEHSVVDSFWKEYLASKWNFDKAIKTVISKLNINNLAEWIQENLADVIIFKLQDLQNTLKIYLDLNEWKTPELSTNPKINSLIQKSGLASKINNWDVISEITNERVHKLASKARNIIEKYQNKLEDYSTEQQMAEIETMISMILIEE